MTPNSTGARLAAVAICLLAMTNFSRQMANRGGSHNLVIGRFNQFTSSGWGGLVAGEQNTISDQEASVSSGENNSALGQSTVVIGGNGNSATAPTPSGRTRPSAHKFRDSQVSARAEETSG